MLDGPLDWLHVEGDLEGADQNLGQLALDAHLGLMEGESLWRVVLDANELQLAPIVGLEDQTMVVDAEVHVHGEGYSWPNDVTAEFYALLEKPLQIGEQQLAAMEMQGHRHGRLELASIDSSMASLGTVKGFADFDVVEGAVLAELHGDVVPTQFGVGGTGRFVATVDGNAYEPPLDVDARLHLTAASFGDELTAGHWSPK